MIKKLHFKIKIISNASWNNVQTRHAFILYYQGYNNSMINYNEQLLTPVFISLFFMKVANFVNKLIIYTLVIFIIHYNTFRRCLPKFRIFGSLQSFRKLGWLWNIIWKFLRTGWLGYGRVAYARWVLCPKSVFYYNIQCLNVFAAFKIKKLNFSVNLWCNYAYQ